MKISELWDKIWAHSCIGGRCFCPIMPLLLVLILLVAVLGGGCGRDATSATASVPASAAADLVRARPDPAATARIVAAIREHPIGAVGPRLLYATGNDVFIAHFRGVLRYDLEQRKIVDAIDNYALGLSEMQGSNPLYLRGDKESVVLTDGRKAYRYELATGRLAKLPIDQVDAYGKPIPLPSSYLPSPGKNEPLTSAEGLMAGRLMVILSYQWAQDRGRSWHLHWQRTDGHLTRHTAPVFTDAD